MNSIEFYIALSSLVGSSASLVCTSVAILIFLLCLPVTERNLRSNLVVCLLTAEMLNALNNTISGAYSMQQDLRPSFWCTVNGFVGQVTVQATDLSVLCISVLTFWVLTQQQERVAVLTKNPQLWFAIVWLPSLLTACINIGLVGYAPSSTSHSTWCWIASQPNPQATIVRNALTHVPRLIIIVTILVLHVLIAARLCHGLRDSNSDNKADADKEHRWMLHNAIVRLLSFPIAYILLWIPGIANRLAEEIGHSSDVLLLLQTCTQYIGLAHGIICMWNLAVIMQMYSKHAHQIK